jgi:hypothetical protein
MSVNVENSVPWRQGHILPPEALEELKLWHANKEDTCVVVISHDCDLARDAALEPKVEVIVGRKLLKGNGNFFWAKSPRTLHVDIDQNKQHIGVVELVATEKTLINKELLLPKFSPDFSYSFSAKSLSSLRSWLSVRYDRSAFPDDFVDAFNCNGFGSKFEKSFKKEGNLLDTVYFDLDRGLQKDHSDGSPYELSIVLMYFPGVDPEATLTKVEELAEKISDLFTSEYFIEASETWDQIQLLNCYPISDEEMTISLSRTLMEWRLEHMTLRDN